MTYQQIIQELKKGVYAPVYFLCGEETFYIDKVEEYIEQNALDPATKDFNLHIYYAKDTEPAAVLNTCMQLPNFAERQLIIVREAQQYKSFEAFEKYLDKPVPSTILVFSHKYKTPDKRTAFGKNIQKNSVYLESAKLKDNELPTWIIEAAKSVGMQLQQAQAQLLAEYLGNDLSRLYNEIDKLHLLIGNSTVTSEHIEKHIGISREYNSLELSKAFEQKNIAKALLIIDYFKKNPKAGPIQMILATLYGFFSKLYGVNMMLESSEGEIASALGIAPFFVKNYKDALRMYNLSQIERAISVIAEYDGRSKGIDNAADDAALMEELVFKIML